MILCDLHCIPRRIIIVIWIIDIAKLSLHVFTRFFFRTWPGGRDSILYQPSRAKDAMGSSRILWSDGVTSGNEYRQVFCLQICPQITQGAAKAVFGSPRSQVGALCLQRARFDGRQKRQFDCSAPDDCCASKSAVIDEIPKNSGLHERPVPQTKKTKWLTRNPLWIS